MSCCNATRYVRYANEENDICLSETCYDDWRSTYARVIVYRRITVLTCTLRRL